MFRWRMPVSVLTILANERWGCTVANQSLLHLFIPSGFVLGRLTEAKRKQREWIISLLDFFLLLLSHEVGRWLILAPPPSSRECCFTYWDGLTVSEKAFDSFSSCLALAGEEVSHVENDNSMIATKKGKHARKEEEGLEEWGGVGQGRDTSSERAGEREGSMCCVWREFMLQKEEKKWLVWSRGGGGRDICDFSPASQIHSLLFCTCSAPEQYRLWIKEIFISHLPLASHLSQINKTSQEGSVCSGAAIVFSRMDRCTNTLPVTRWNFMPEN